MAGIHETTMTLRFFGDDLDPDEITSRLGCPPTVGMRKGGVSNTKRGTEKVARTGARRLVSKARRPGDLDGQLSEMLALLSNDLNIWAELTERFLADIFPAYLWENAMRR